ncbi:MAG: antibiotic biosynthesis monooxygenase [Desulfobacterales bacterium]|nr:antibiotic biosynthesis monooxygenase [Desulfobacterales bacterium]
MIVKVIIKREVKPGMDHDFFELLKSLRSHAVQQPGYISGETLLCAEDTNKVLIISKWESLADWKNWKANPHRREVDAKMADLQLQPTEYEPYVFSKYKAAAELEFPPPLQKTDL